MIQAQDFVETLQLKILSPSAQTEWDIHSAETNRPGMQFCGFYEYFAFERPQVIGKVEMTYLNGMEASARKAMLKKYFSYNMPCVIICRGLQPPEDLLEQAANHGIGVYSTDLLTTKFCFDCVTFLNHRLAPWVRRHGVLVDVHGVGVLLTGDSGVGKSETALELIKRGHALIADDVVDIWRVSDDRLIGECPEMVRHLMEIRGMGIIDIRAMYGVSAVGVKKSIDLVMHLEQWIEGKAYDRLGLEDEYITILGVKIPHQLTPVRPGRNLAIIIEVAARNLSLKRLGYSAAKELDRKLNEKIQMSMNDIKRMSEFM